MGGPGALGGNLGGLGGTMGGGAGVIGPGAGGLGASGLGVGSLNSRYHHNNFDPRYNTRYDNLYGGNGFVDNYRDNYNYTDNDVDLYANAFDRRHRRRKRDFLNPFSSSRRMEMYPQGGFQDRFVPSSLRTPLHNPYEEDLPGMSRRQYEKLERNFRQIDVNGTGSIGPMELQLAMRNSDGTPFDISTIEIIFQVFDRDNSRSLEINEFFYLMKSLDYWNKIFRRFDVNGSGAINFTEYVQLLRYFGYNFQMETCAFIYKKFALYDDSMLRGESSKLVLKFDKFFESFLCLTHFFNQYGVDPQRNDIDYFLFNNFDSMNLATGAY